jgi:CDP-glycerol glycerophosphotransferase (TagB/SpsB family)
VLDLCLNVLLSTLSLFVPKRKGSVVFGSMALWWNAGFNNSSKSMFLYLISNGHRQLVTWVTAKPEEYLLLKSKGYPIVYKYSPICFWKILRAEFLVTTEDNEHLTYSYVPGRFKIIQLYHGTPLKKIGSDDKMNQEINGRYASGSSLAKRVTDIAWAKIFHHLHEIRLRPFFLTVATSEEDQRVFQRVFYSRSVEILGSPRNDIFFYPHLISEDYAKKLKLGAFSKVLLYAPTFRDRQAVMEPFSKDFAITLGDYLANNNYLMLVKGHPSRKHTKVRFEAAGNIVDVSDIIGDIQEILIHVDILITDYSSVAFDFALTGRPIIYFPYDFENYIETCRGMYYEYFHVLPGPFARNETELLELIRTVADWSSGQDYAERYLSFRKRFNEFEDGRSSQRVLTRLGIIS